LSPRFTDVTVNPTVMAETLRVSFSSFPQSQAHSPARQVDNLPRLASGATYVEYSVVLKVSRTGLPAGPSTVAHSWKMRAWQWRQRSRSSLANMAAMASRLNEKTFSSPISARYPLLRSKSHSPSLTFGKVQATTKPASASRFLHKKLRARDIDKINITCHNQQVAMLGIPVLEHI
jgi:hypothetical protein